MTVTVDRPLTRNIREGAEPLGLREYQQAGGYEGLRRALAEMTANDFTQEVKASNLRGRGGAGFNTGMKWSFVPRDRESHPHYLIANADEMEPGTFKDRYLLEGDPHQLIEGMILSAWAIEAEVGYIFVRDEYRRSHDVLRAALEEARRAGYLGDNILDSGFKLELRLHVSAGRYMCGEETGLLNALQGKRATPRAKPPFPQVSGLWGKPTIVQNVETLCNLPHIALHGADWFKKLSRTENGGTKLYGVSGKVKRPGLWELPLGATMRELLELAGGMCAGLHFRGALPGGASTDFITEEHLEVPLDFGAMMRVGSRLGTGTAIVLDDRTCPVAFVLNLERFFSRESCGWCTPCREGLPWAVRLLEAIEQGRGEADDLQRLDEHCAGLAMGHTFCALAPGAVEPLQSALRYFRADFERHVSDKRCPWRA